jgi:hypothetical protein
MNREKPVRQFPKLRLPKIRRYPIWNPRTVTAVAVLVIGICTTIVLVAGKRSLFIELELALGLVSICVFWFLTVGLYRGIRLRKDRFPSPSAPQEKPSESFDFPDLPVWDFGDEIGCLGPILGLIFAAIAFIGLLVVIYWAMPYLVVGVLFLIAAIYWVFYIALRRVFVLSRRCRGNWGLSTLYGAGYTGLYTAWLFLVLIAARYWLEK